MKSQKKTRIKGIANSKYSNGLELQFLTCTVMGILVDMSRDTLQEFHTKGWTDRPENGERAGLGH